MKYTLISVMITLSVQCSLAQSLPCGTQPPTSAEFAFIRDVVSHVDLSTFRAAGNTCIPLQAHVVYKNDSTGGVSVSRLNRGLTYLNVFYQEEGMEFYWKDFPDVTYNSDYHDFDQTSPDSDSEATLVSFFNTAYDAINIYVVGSIVTSAGLSASGYAYYPCASNTCNRIVLRSSSVWAGPGTICHELGHYFSLVHTHNGTESGPGSSNAENVPRTGPDANCATKGDLMCDTEADPKHDSNLFDYSDCEYTGNEVDINGIPYDPPVDNIMSYYPQVCDNHEFTPQQYTKIAQGLVTRQNYTAYSLDAQPAAVAVPTDLTASAIHTGVRLGWTDIANNEMGYLIERSYISDTSGFEPNARHHTGPDDTTWYNRQVPSHTTIWYRMKAANGSCDLYSNVAMVHTGDVYCFPNHFFSCDAGSEVVIGSFSLIGETTSISSSGGACSPGGYGDHTHISADLVAGSSYTFSADAFNASGGQYATRLQIWIDLDQNGSLSDPGEQMLSSSVLMDPDHTGIISIPTSALNGPTLMRVRGWSDHNGCNASPCSTCIRGEAEDYTVNIVGGVPNDVEINARVLLQGPFNGIDMSDELRSAGLIPTNEPYAVIFGHSGDGGNETVSNPVLSTVGNDAVVDWIYLELRDKDDSTLVLSTRSALLQRDGDIVDTDGVSPVHFQRMPGDYYVAIRHRNHLGVMTASPVSLDQPSATLLDLTDLATPVFGVDARYTVGNLGVLWMGDCTTDGVIQYAGAVNDSDPILGRIGGLVPTMVVHGYFREDTNMDGAVKFAGAVNDRDPILINIGGSLPTGIRVQQLP